MLQSESQDIRFEANEKPPNGLSIGLAIQLVLLTIGGVVITPVIVVQGAGIGEPFLSWSVFCVLLISGLTTILQAVRVWRFGSGHVLLMGTSGTFIAVCISALTNGGPALMCTLIAASALIQFAVGFNLSLFRRIVTPTVAGVVIMMIPVTIFPIIYDLLVKVPAEHVSFDAPLIAGITIVVATVLAMRATGTLRLWTPVIGLVVGTVIAVPLGLFDVGPIIEASWVGFPDWAWPGFDLSFGPQFWALLPGFVLATIVGLVETIGDSVAIQRVSQRKPRAPDYRVVQGAVGADGVGNLLSGLFGTVPNTTYSSSVAVTEITGVAARRIGVYIGVIFLLLALLPKLTALVVALPNPVVGAYLTILMSILFVVGIKLVVREGLDFRSTTIVGVSVWLGIGFQYDLIFPSVVPDTGFWGTLLSNGMNVGGLSAIFLTLLTELMSSRRRRTKTKLSIDILPDLNTFLTESTKRFGWDEPSINRVHQINEELLLTLLNTENEESDSDHKQRSLQVSIQLDSGQVVLEYIAAESDENIEDRAMVLQEAATDSSPSDISVLLLNHLAKEIRHQTYFDMDIINVRIDPVVVAEANG